MSAALEGFLAECRAIAARTPDPAECVLRCAPLMEGLLAGAPGFLAVSHRRTDPGRYCRNAVHIAADGSLSLFAIAWLPGQWTPVHDHGSWGVVGVVEGVLEERAYMSPHGTVRGDTGIHLQRGGVVLLRSGSVTSFVPNPDHIHVTGVPAERGPALSLHLYGRNMNSFHVYDVAAGTRRLIDVPHNES